MHRTKLLVTVLSEDPIPETMDLDDIVHEGSIGDFVLDVGTIESVEISDGEMRRALLAAGSDPEFFMPD